MAGRSAARITVAAVKTHHSLTSTRKLTTRGLSTTLLDSFGPVQPLSAAPKATLIGKLLFELRGRTHTVHQGRRASHMTRLSANKKGMDSVKIRKGEAASTKKRGGRGNSTVVINHAPTIRGHCAAHDLPTRRGTGKCARCRKR